MIEGLKFFSLNGHVYTWVNVNLNFAELTFFIFSKIHVPLLTENKSTCALPFSFHFSFY